MMQKWDGDEFRPEESKKSEEEVTVRRLLVVATQDTSWGVQVYDLVVLVALQFELLLAKKALMLDENYVQSLQNKIQIISLKHASVNPIYDYETDLEAFMVDKPHQGITNIVEAVPGIIGVALTIC
ncbi:hypothetical protein Tco_1221652 [Tanacetum coccineum]